MEMHDYAYGLCHSLTLAMLDMVGAGEPVGLFVGGQCTHSAFRPPQSAALVDAHGSEIDRECCARRYVRPGEAFEWRSLSIEALENLAAGANRLRLRKLRSAARPFARAALAAA